MKKSFSESIPNVGSKVWAMIPSTFTFVAGLSFSVTALAAEPASDAKPAEPWKAEISGPYDSKLRLEVNERVRGEVADWFGDPIVKGKVVPKESSYHFLGNKFQLGLRLTSKPFEAFAQFQDTTLVNLPDSGVGVGSVYYLNDPHKDQNSAFLRQGWAKFKYDGFYLTGGRQLYSDGVQGAARHKNLKWIQDFRLGQRLIGPFEYTHAGRSFDGGTIGYLSDDFEASGFAFLPTYGGFNINGMSNISDINIAGASLNLRDSATIGDTIARLSYYYYSDTRGLVATDSRPDPARRSTKGQAIEIHTIGAHAAHILPLGPGLADGMLFGYGQAGDWQGQDHSAWAYGAEIGYQLPDVWSSPWLRAGINSGSGDPNPNDGNHQTFFQLLPTAWLYAQFPFYNMMNNQDVFLQAILKPHAMVNVRMDFHWLSVNESKDLLYSGAGATSDRVFGYAGAPTGGNTDIAYLTHLMVSVKPNNYLTFNMLYGHAFGQEVIDAQYANKQGDYGFVEAVVSF